MATRTNIGNVEQVGSGSTSNAEQKARVRAARRMVAVHRLRAHPLQPPERHSDANVTDLVESILELGLLELPTVWRRADGTYVILFGHRRIRACQLIAMRGLGEDRVPAFVRDDLTEGEAALLIAAEYGHRMEFSAVHTATVIGAAHRMLSADEKTGASVRRMAAILPWEKTSIDDYLKIDKALRDPRTADLVRSMDKEGKSLLVNVLSQPTFSARIRVLKAYQSGGAAVVRQALAAAKNGRPQKAVTRSKRGEGYDMTVRLRPSMTAEAIVEVLAAISTLRADLEALQVARLGPEE
jgi:ParB/RepB/Spo0J family partition protein